MADVAEENGGRSWWQVGLQIVAIVFVVQMMTGAGSKKSAQEANSVEVDLPAAASPEGVAPSDARASKKPQSKLMPLFSQGHRLDMRMYIAESADPRDLALDGSFLPSPAGSSLYPQLVWEERDIRLNWDDSNFREKSMMLKPSENMHNNATIFAHVIFAPAGVPSPQPDRVFHSVHQLNRYRKQKKYVSTKNLLSGEVKGPEHREQVVTRDEDLSIISYWNPNVTLHIVDDFTAYSSLSAVPDPLKPFLRKHPSGPYYYPIIFWNEFWVLNEHFYPLNDTLEEIPLHLSYSPITLWKFMLSTQMEDSLTMQQSFGSSESELDDIKRMLLETNPMLLGLTIGVSLLHMVFDFLAFTNDVSFWKNKKNMAGMSVRTLFVNTVSQLIIFLYLLDNETSFMVLMSSGIGLVIDFWKISKAVNVKIVRSSVVPYPWFDYKDTYVESSTSEYDRLAFKYLSWVLFPLVILYAIYSLMYDTHRSWYSWVLGSLTGAVYTFGFIMMTPQLFINYKLKSVAHLNGRVFMYKALNTFIDDLFAFIIKMPTMHRLACLRDDLIFFVYLYQRWLYPVDKSRYNEFGVTGEQDETRNTAVVVGEGNQETNDPADDEHEEQSSVGISGKKKTE
eukprot:TRINITY_DN11339_c0_g1_i2.p1 TRINITY_DN11339_c0_g1~~TRINITY_DN11339_c0_g1_i2.p1  ORF type:complete len:620 (-),score=162.83 TRINITY_DN11339_c0_g1_i2:29-1888(-)